MARVETKDIALAAWFKLNKLEVVSANRKGRDYLFVFEDPEEKADGLRTAFANSEAQAFDHEVRALKKLLERP